MTTPFHNKSLLLQYKKKTALLHLHLRISPKRETFYIRKDNAKGARLDNNVAIMCHLHKSKRPRCIMTACNCVCKDFHFHYSIVHYCEVLMSVKKLKRQTHLTCFPDCLVNNSHISLQCVQYAQQLQTSEEFLLLLQRNHYTGYTSNRR